MFAPVEKREPEKIVTHVPKKSIHKKPIIVKKPKVISEEETAQAEVDAMLDVEKKTRCSPKQTNGRQRNQKSGSRIQTNYLW